MSSRASPNDATNNKANSQGATGSPSLVGMINNLISSDLENIVGMAELPVLIVYAPLKIMISVYFLYKLLGWRYRGVSYCTSIGVLIDDIFTLISVFPGMGLIIIGYIIPGAKIRPLRILFS